MRDDVESLSQDEKESWNFKCLIDSIRNQKNKNSCKMCATDEFSVWMIFSKRNFQPIKTTTMKQMKKKMKEIH